MYMREYWVQVHQSPIVYRYVDWSITVPLQMIEFNLILKAAGKPTSAAMFWKLLGGTVMMLSFGYLGEIGALLAWPAFAGGMLGWFFILFEIFNDNQLLHTQGVGQKGVLTGLTVLGDTGLELSHTSSDNQYTTIRLGSSSDHVLDEISVAGGVNDGHIELGSF